MKIFLTIVKSFEQQLPLSEPPDLLQDWEYLYERSIGCVGILKDWLVKALVSVSRRNAGSLTRKDLEAQAPSVAQCDKMLSEAVEGEVRLSESAEERNRLRTRLGLSAKENSGGDAADSAIKIAAPTRNPLKPGQRRPIRDAVGTTSSMEANGSRL